MLRTIFSLLFLAGWSLAALSLHVVRLPEGFIGLLPKDHLTITDTYLDVRPWTAADAPAHPDFVKRIVQANRTEWLKHLSDPAKRDVADQLTEMLTPPPAARDCAHQGARHFGPAEMKPSGDRPLPIRLMHAANRLLCRAYHHVDVRGPFVQPHDGPLVIVCNHFSSIDPLTIQSLIYRPIVWMVAREYTIGPGLDWLFRTLRAIPVSRDGKDSTALRAAMRALSDGHILGIFPEGRFTNTDEVLPFETGAAMIALRAGVPVLPIGQNGTARGQSMVGAVVVPQQVRMNIGAIIDLKSRFGKTKDFDAPTKLIESAVRELAARR